MEKAVWTTDPPKYPGYYWAISQHGEIDMVRVRCVMLDYMRPADPVGTPSKFNYTFGDTCASDTVRWTHWTPVVPPGCPETLPVPPVVQETAPRKMGDKERDIKTLEDTIREHMKTAPLEAKFQTFVAGEGETISETVYVGDSMMVLDGVAVIADAGVKATTERCDREKGWNLIPKTRLDMLSQLNQGRVAVGVRHLLGLAKEIAEKVSQLSEDGREGAYRRLRAVNPMMWCMVKSFVTSEKEKEDNSLPRP